MTAIIISDNEKQISPEYQLEECKKSLNRNEEFKVFTCGEIDDFQSDGNWDDFETLLEKGKVSKVIIYRFDAICDNFLDLASVISLINDYSKLLSCFEAFDSSTESGKYIQKLFQLFSNEEFRYVLDDELEKMYSWTEINS